MLNRTALYYTVLYCITWNKITGIIHKIAEETFGKASKKQPNDWFDKECQEATEVKNKAYINTQQQSYTTTSTVKYREARRKEKQVHNRKKKQHENDQVETGGIRTTTSNQKIL